MTAREELHALLDELADAQLDVETLTRAINACARSVGPLPEGYQPPLAVRLWTEKLQAIASDLSQQQWLTEIQVSAHQLGMLGEAQQAIVQRFTTSSGWSFSLVPSSLLLTPA